jgi:hypothetical protein
LQLLLDLFTNVIRDLTDTAAAARSSCPLPRRICVNSPFLPKKWILNLDLLLRVDHRNLQVKFFPKQLKDPAIDSCFFPPPILIERKSWQIKTFCPTTGRKAISVVPPEFRGAAAALHQPDFG